MLRYIAVSFILVFIFSISGFTQENNSEQPKIALSDLSIDMQWFLSYLNGKENGTTFNQFTLKRGYVNIKKKINNQLSGRITIDITRDLEGDGEGDIGGCGDGDCDGCGVVKGCPPILTSQTSLDGKVILMSCSTDAFELPVTVTVV